MASLEWGAVTNADGTSFGPIPETSATTTLSLMSTPFLNLPRELRDEIYRHLLSTKNTKQVFEESPRVSPNCITDSTKLIQPSGLFTGTV